ncbi:thioredoxin family protein [Phormidium sp. CCY1219]|uniref:thioredoxin family protein n=1 Tax=Phormidium sp. CCY1219 TaxID=2886104 RepID=UPI002D1EC534|nr:thioredoxin domain-containing protein [Phormidium sp. CCY1219]MEB3829750.1 redoxin domain-containing protein [Phormidium sp. CCY1219]
MVLSLNEQTFKEEVLEAPTPVLVNFWAPWCGLCRTIDPILNAFAQEWGEQIKLVGINADRTLKLASGYRITTLPTLILFDSGVALHRIEGFHGRDDLQAMLRSRMREVMQKRFVTRSLEHLINSSSV